MNILTKLFPKRAFPKQLKRQWFAYACMRSSDLYDYEIEPPYFDKDKKYIEYKSGDIVPMRKNKTHIAFYRITRWEKHGSDLAGWDDGRNYDLVLDHVERRKP